jgi:hypothetical protein
MSNSRRLPVNFIAPLPGSGLRWFCTLLPSLLLLAWMQPAWSSERLLDYLNQLRQQAGMTALQHQAALSTAAQNHADYLANNTWLEHKQTLPSAHHEEPGDVYFTGAEVGQRVMHAGYAHEAVLENISQGPAEMQPQDAVDGLMSAIYHRFTFLDLAADEVGIGTRDGVHVFELGRSDLRDLCTAPQEEALFTAPVYCLDTLVTSSYYDEMCGLIPEHARYQAPWHESCANGARLDAAYMQNFCKQPPAAALLQGRGRYYKLCDGRWKVRKRWFDKLCGAPPEEAAYRHSGRYYSICDDQVRVNESWYREQCSQLPESARYRESGSYQLFCAAPQRKVRPEYLQQRLREQQLQNPELVVWPPHGATDVPPAFFEEEPDPLPDFSVSGYPLSIQVNPAVWKEAVLVSFMLYRESGGEWLSVDILPPMDSSNDPNQRFSDHQFALFPVKRLQWKSRYRALAELKLDGQRRRVEWSFTTRDPGGELIDLSVNDVPATLRVSRDYILYWPVSHGAHRPATSQVATRFQQGIDMQLSVIDPDTVELRVEAEVCSKVAVEFSLDRKAEFQLTGCHRG